MLANQSLQGSSSGSTKNWNNQSTGRPNNFVCSHCGETSHLKQWYYEIIGYPEWWDFSKKEGASNHMTRDSSRLQSVHLSPQSVISIANVNDPCEIKLLQYYLAAEFEMKDLGQLKYFLGIEIPRSAQEISLSQRKYVLDLLTETRMLACKPVENPIKMNHRLGSFPNQAPTDIGRYQWLVGYSLCCKCCSQLMHTPSKEHMNATYKILRYLNGTPGKGLLFSKDGVSNFEGYTDADWSGNQTTRRSTSGYFMFVEENLVTWKSKKEKVVARSSAEVEYRGMAHGVRKLFWVRSILQDLWIEHAKPMNLYCDNKSAIEIAQNPVQHDRVKHVEVNRHFIREKLDQNIIQFLFMRSESQIVDILTKAVSGRIFHHVIGKLGMIDIYAPT
ncbi:hypothetical protein RJ639_030274 [Escallonia herrerae]|uniref:Reverse transcriptase Ty1/copia-type domain-containing protein n=1 Tax=Escallonia herrerae TaxID=1293975 RepID=A0AA88X485_9ASTE|nr:hypothetical protein RJ639_030274 [Escallonia herrerae]